jgi:hypothetical protein
MGDWQLGVPLDPTEPKNAQVENDQANDMMRLTCLVMIQIVVNKAWYNITIRSIRAGKTF